MKTSPPKVVTLNEDVLNIFRQLGEKAKREEYERLGFHWENDVDDVSDDDYCSESDDCESDDSAYCVSDHNHLMLPPAHPNNHNNNSSGSGINRSSTASPNLLKTSLKSSVTSPGTTAPKNAFATSGGGIHGRRSSYSIERKSSRNANVPSPKPGGGPMPFQKQLDGSGSKSSSFASRSASAPLVRNNLSVTISLPRLGKILESRQRRREKELEVLNRKLEITSQRVRSMAT